MFKVDVNFHEDIVRKAFHCDCFVTIDIMTWLTWWYQSVTLLHAPPAHQPVSSQRVINIHMDILVQIHLAN